MPLRIAFDLDGVLADMESELVRQAEVVFGEATIRKLRERAEPAHAVPPPHSSPPSTASEPQQAAEASNDVPPLLKLNMTLRQQRTLWRHVESIENFWETLEELETGVIARLAAIAAERRWEIIFLTKRPESAGATAQMQSQRWLQSRGFALPSVYVVQGSRGRIAAALDLDIVVDDRPENCFDVVVDSRARAILVWRDDETRIPPAVQRLGLGVVHSVSECLDVLTQIDHIGRGDEGMISKVLRLLRLKQPAPA